MSYRIQYFAILVLSLLAKALPVSAATWTARRVGDLTYWILGKRREIALENVARAFGNSITEARKKQIVRSAFQSASLSLMELFIVEKIKKEAQTFLSLFQYAYCRSRSYLLEN